MEFELKTSQLLEELKRALPDIQSQRPVHEIALTRVGVSKFRYPVLLRRNGENLQVFVTIEASVNLPPEQRGAHMSRFAEEIIRAFEFPLEASSFEELAERLAQELLDAHNYAQYCTVTLETESHLEGHPFKLFASYDTATKQRFLGVEVYGALACPCAMAMTGSVTHNQRGALRIELQTNGYSITPEELVSIAEAAFSTPVRLLLKRPQEKEIVEAMHKNPKFVEDVVRDCVMALKERYKGVWAKVRCDSFESIHPYDVFAEWEGVL
ncbi:MAG: GTP cyclohydrolase I FolE2 [Armatimonadetes bacterium]|nr:GTP cyclohydrolase I FolE2 [Armatimonadota bacterium]MDW8029157.1 GTP cyclohydrolase I FolE2 [Armatimonadota bacterium]